MDLLEYALSPSTRSGVVRGRPVPRRGVRMPSRTWPNAVASLTLPGVSTIDRGRPQPSTARWTLVVSPPRERPRAWPACERPGSSSSSPFAPPFFAGADCVLVGSVDGGVDGDGPFHPAHRVIADLNVLQQPCPGAVRLPAGEPLVDGLPRPEPVGKIPPRSPGPQPPQHPVDHLPVITPRTAPSVHLRQKGLYPPPCRVRQLTSTCHKINYQTGYRVLPW